MVADQAYEMTTTDSGVPVRLVPAQRQPKEECLTLTPQELAWLNEFRQRLLDQFPESVNDIIVHGFRARGLADEDLDLNALVVSSDEQPADSTTIHQSAFAISLETGAYPVVMTALQSELERDFYQSRVNDGISVL